VGGRGIPPDAPESGIGACWRAFVSRMSKVKHFEDATFEQDVLNSGTPVLVDFYADWCGPCKMMAPVVEGLAEQFEGTLIVGKLDTDASPDIAVRYGIMGIPTLGYFRAGELVDRLVGYPGPSGVRAFVEKNTQPAKTA
jgi:thioredoxin 1